MIIESVVLSYLDHVLSVPVYAEKPEEPPLRYVLIEKTGGASENYIMRATIAIQSYAESMAEAAKLNEEVKTAMDDIIVLDSIGASQYNSDYNFTDTTKKQYRYQAVYELFY